MSQAQKKSPDNFKIILGHKEIEILPLERTDSDAHEVHGFYFPNHSKIKIDMSQNVAESAETLVHEVLHAVWNQMCLKSENVNEEDVVTALSKGICLLIKQNPDFFTLVKNAIINNKKIKI